MNRSVAFVFLLFFPFYLHSQIGGRGVYEFTNLTSSARVAALGGKQIAIWDDDLNLVFHNPSLLTPAMNNNIALSYVNYFTDINYGYFTYVNTIKDKHTFAGGIQYIHYGEFIEADETGVITGHFTAAEYAFNIVYSHSFDSMLHVGVNLKPLYSSLERYNSFGLAADIGCTYHNPSRLFTAALVIRNFGTQFKGYYSGHRETLPFEIQLGLSQKLKYAPFRFSITAHQIQTLDMTYEVEDDDDFNDYFNQGNTEPSKLEQFGDKVMRHMIVGVEFLPLKSFTFRAGYNYQRRKEMQVPVRIAMVGFSWGVGLKIKKFHLNYGRASYHLAGGTNHFSISTNFNEFNRKK